MLVLELFQARLLLRSSDQVVAGPGKLRSWKGSLLPRSSGRQLPLVCPRWPGRQAGTNGGLVRRQVNLIPKRWPADGWLAGEAAVQLFVAGAVQVERADGVVSAATQSQQEEVFHGGVEEHGNKLLIGVDALVVLGANDRPFPRDPASDSRRCLTSDPLRIRLGTDHQHEVRRFDLLLHPDGPALFRP